jgi:hypothetical protein
VFEREGHRFPELRDRMRSGLSDRGYQVMAAFLERWAATRRLPSQDTAAIAVLLGGALLNFRRSTWTLGASPLGLGDDRIVTAFVAICEAIVGGADK